MVQNSHSWGDCHRVDLKKKTALLSNHAERLIRREQSHGEQKRSQKRETVHQGALSMLHAHKSLLGLDEKLRKLRSPRNTTRDKKRKIQVLEENVQAQMSELKKRQEALRKGLENMAREKGVVNSEMVVTMEVTTKQLDATSIQALFKDIMPDENDEDESVGDDSQDESVGDDSQNKSVGDDS